MLAPKPEPTKARARGKAGNATRAYSAADNWVGNRWTIEANGRTHKFFFLSGPYKSGTHWVMRVLNLHPDVNIKGEFHFEALWQGYSQLTSVPWYLSAKQPAASVATDSVEDLIRRVMYTQTRDKPEATWLGDRTPRGCAEFLPGAPNILTRRDGRDVMVSWNFHHLRVPDPSRLLDEFQVMGARMCPEFRSDPAKYERRGEGFLANESWFRHHVRIWRDVIQSQLRQVPVLQERGTPVQVIVYEEMLKDAEGHAQRMYEFLGLDARQAAPLSQGSMTTPGVAEPSPLKFMRKGTSGEWREYFDERQVRWFKEEAGETLIEAGYEQNNDW